MADAMISDLSAAVSLALTDLIEVEQGSSPSNSSKHGTIQQLLDLITANLSLDNSKNTVTDLVISGGVVNIDLAGGAKKNFRLTLTSNVTVTFSNLPAAGYVAEYDLEIKQNATGGWTYTLPASHKALGGSDTAIASAANAVTILSAKSWDQGTSWAYAMQERA